MKRFACISNSQSGTAPATQDIVGSFRKAGGQVECLAIQKGQAAITEIVKGGGYAAIVAAGGDGTVNLAAEIAIELGLPLGVLPVGTLNHFAKDVGIPLGLDEATETVCSGKLQPVDFCTVNDKVFLNNASIGMYPSMVLDRDSKKYGSKWLATVTAFSAALFRDHRLRATIKVETSTISLRSPMLFIGNNRYELERIGFTKRDHLTSGKLFLYIVKTNRVTSLILIALLSLVGMRHRKADIIRETSESIVITTGQKNLTVAVDGEVVHLDSPLTFTMHAGGLEVFVPS